MTRRLLVAALAACAVTGALAAQQPIHVSGLVVDAATGQAISGAEIRLGDDSRSTSTMGRFEFGSVRPGSSQLTVRAVGHVSHTAALELVAGDDRNLSIALAALPIALDTLTVFAASETMLDGGALVARGSDLATALSGWAGIVISRTGAGNAAVPQIRGSAPEEVLVVMDGFMLNDPFTGRADLSHIATRDVARLTLDRGAQTARYGSRALAGVINIETRRAPGPEMSADFGSFESVAARMGASAGPLSGSFTFDRLENGFQFETASGTEATRTNVGGEVYGLNARTSGPLQLTLRSSLSERDLPGTTRNPTPSARASDKTVFLGVRRGDANTITASLSWLRSQVQDTAPPPGFTAYDSRTEAWGATAAFAATRSARLGGWAGSWSAGAESRYDRFSGDAVQAGADFGRAGVALNAEMTRRYGPDLWSISPAARIDWWSGQSVPRASGRVDGHWSRQGTTISLGFGNGVTVPALADLLFRQDEGVVLNPNLRPERVRWEIEGGVRQQLTFVGINGSLDVTGFDGRVTDMILWSATGGSQRTWRPDNFNVRRRGFEVSLEARPMSSLSISGSSALSDVRYDRPGGAQVRYRPRASHAVFITWSPRSWRATVRWNHLGSRFPNASGTNPLPPFDLMSASVEYPFGSTLTIRAEVRDLLDTRATYIAGYPTAGRAYHLSFTLELP
ncbi:MAG: TonB-dependent receptor [Gemmatimonadota bacterium]